MASHPSDRCKPNCDGSCGPCLRAGLQMLPASPSLEHDLGSFCCAWWEGGEAGAEDAQAPAPSRDLGRRPPQDCPSLLDLSGAQGRLPPHHHQHRGLQGHSFVSSAPRPIMTMREAPTYSASAPSLLMSEPALPWHTAAHPARSQPQPPPPMWAPAPANQKWPRSTLAASDICARPPLPETPFLACPPLSLPPVPARGKAALNQAAAHLSTRCSSGLSADSCVSSSCALVLGSSPPSARAPFRAATEQWLAAMLQQQAPQQDDPPCHPAPQRQQQQVPSKAPRRQPAPAKRRNSGGGGGGARKGSSEEDVPYAVQRNREIQRAYLQRKKVHFPSPQPKPPCIAPGAPSWHLSFSCCCISASASSDCLPGALPTACMHTCTQDIQCWTWSADCLHRLAVTGEGGGGPRTRGRAGAPKGGAAGRAGAAAGAPRGARLQAAPRPAAGARRREEAVWGFRAFQNPKV